jgi:hypothetical protein
MVLVTAVTMREMSYLQKNAIIFQACAGFQCNSSVEGASQMNWSGESGGCWSMENDEANYILTSFTVTTKCFMKNVIYCDDNKVLHEERHILWQRSASWRTSCTVTTQCFMEKIICCDKGLHEELCAKEQVYYLLPSHFDIRCRSLVPWMTVSPFYLLLMRSPVGGNSVVPNSFGKIQFLHFLMMVLFHEVTINVARIPTPYYGMHHYLPCLEHCKSCCTISLAFFIYVP